MTETPPPPPEDRPHADRDFDPRRRSVFPPPEPVANEPVGCAGRIALVLLGCVSFVMALGVFISVLASGQPPIGLAVALVVLVGLFVIRRKSGRSPALGAVIVGVSVAVVVFGGCMLILMSGKLDFK